MSEVVGAILTGSFTFLVGTLIVVWVIVRMFFEFLGSMDKGEERRK